MDLDLLRTTVDQVFTAHAAAEPLPGLAYGVVHGGELVHSAGLGTLRLGETSTPDADSVFRIASMTKSFTAATVLLLRDEGRLRLDDPVCRYVPELVGGGADERVTVRSLLTMTAGFPTDDPWGDRQQGLASDGFAAFLASGPWQSWQPGEAFEYSNLGYALLGRVTESVTGSPLRDTVTERLLAPLGMAATCFLSETVPSGRLAAGYVPRDGGWVEEPPAGYGAFAAMGGLFSSVRDLATWVAGFLAPDAGDRAHPLAWPSRREMQSTARLADGDVTVDPVDGVPRLRVRGYGMGLFEEHLPEGRTVGHPGGYPGFGSAMRWHPASGLAVIALGSRTYAPMNRVSTQALCAAVRSCAPATARRIDGGAPRLGAAREAVNQLVNGWDDDLADRWLAANVALDEPLEHRQAALAVLRQRHGRLRESTDGPPITPGTPSTQGWWLDGERGGRVRVEIMLSPHPQPLVQWWHVVSVPEPSAALRARAVAALLEHAAHPWWSAARLGPVTGGDGSARATYAVLGGTLDAELVIGADGDRLRVLPVPADIR